MEENEKKEDSVKSFKTVQNPNTYKNIYKNENTAKTKVGFGKSVLLPFFSGVVGCAVVLRYLFWSSFYSFKSVKYKFYIK